MQLNPESSLQPRRKVNNGPGVVGQPQGPDWETIQRRRRGRCAVCEGGRKKCAGGVFISLSHYGKNGRGFSLKSLAEIMLRT